MLMDVLQQMIVLFLVFIRSFMMSILGSSRIERRLKKESTRGFIGVKDEIEDGLDKLSSLK